MNELNFVIFATVFQQVTFADGAKNCTILGFNTTCSRGTYFDTTKQVCLACKQCKIGKGVRCGCRYHSNTKCEWCSKGTFSKYEHGNRFCTPCTKCRAYEKEIRKCNSTDDAICLLKHEPKKPEVKSNIYWIIIGVLSALVLITFSCLIGVAMRMYQNRYYAPPQFTRDGDTSNASEAQYCDASSISDLDESRWKRERLKYNDSSYSSLDESRWRRKDDRDSIQSSLLSSENHSGSERASYRTLQNQEVLVSSLPASVYQDLGRLLNPSQAYRDWQTLAGRFGKTQIDIENRKVGDKYDYTERLLMDWCTGKPGATIGELFKIFVEMAREDAAAVLLEYDKKSASKQQRVETPV